MENYELRANKSFHRIAYAPGELRVKPKEKDDQEKGRTGSRKAHCHGDRG